MTDKKPDGGPVFPRTDEIFHKDTGLIQRLPHNGLTLRDYFAARAMQNFCGVLVSESVAKMAYELADAMIKERER